MRSGFGGTAATTNGILWHLPDHSPSGGGRWRFRSFIPAIFSYQVFRHLLPCQHGRHVLESSARDHLGGGRCEPGRGRLEEPGGDERAFKEKLTEAYETKFVVAPDDMTGAEYAYEGKTVRSAILDRYFEVFHRIAGDTVVKWDPTSAPNTLTYNRNDDEVELVVVQRKIEPPSETGFGSDELIRIKSSAGGAFKSLSVYRAARVRRRWRRGFDETTGKRVVDGLEIVTTYRVLDGVAGTEMPTSTTKSRIRMVEM